MISKEAVGYYLIGFFLTCILAGYRRYKGKNDITEIDFLSYMFLWWLFLGMFIVRWSWCKIFKNKNI